MHTSQPTNPPINSKMTTPGRHKCPIHKGFFSLMVYYQVDINNANCVKKVANVEMEELEIQEMSNSIEKKKGKNKQISLVLVCVHSDGTRAP